MRFLSVDPGVEGGWSYWIHSDPPINWGAFRSNKNDLWEAKIEEVMRQFVNLLSSPVDAVYCEWPIFMESNKAASRKDSVTKLMFLVGRIAGACSAKGVDFCPVQVRDWMGQLTPVAIKHRLEKRLGKALTDRITNGHTRDAVAIGLHVLGQW